MSRGAPEVPPEPENLDDFEPIARFFAYCNKFQQNPKGYIEIHFTVPLEEKWDALRVTDHHGQQLYIEVRGVKEEETEEDELDAMLERELGL